MIRIGRKELENVKYNKIRKSLIMSYRVCPRQAYYAVRDPDYEQYNEFNLSSPSLLLGQIFHKEMDKFYSNIDVKKMMNMNQPMLESYLFGQFSKTTHSDLIRYFKWYAKIEAERFLKILMDGKGEIEQRFIPMFIEKYVEWDDGGFIRNGHFDRVDYLGDGKIRLCEYKTGESYDPKKSYKLSKVRFELYWYKEILEHHPEFKDLELTDWMLINPTLETVFISKFSHLTKKAVDRLFDEMKVVLNQDKPPARKLNLYCDNCKFRNECLIFINKSIFDIAVNEEG